jgi:hypothetical protein
MNKKIEFRPTLIIGLGGTGQAVLLKLKKRFVDQFGKVPPIIQFLSIDTTQEAERQNISADGKTGVELEPNNERYIVRVEDAANLIRGKNPHINEWWPKGARVTTIKSGAQQIRALGRLALFSAQKEIKRRITQKLDEVRTIENMNRMQEEGFQVTTSSGVDVFIVTSLAGGTGSGMFIDVAFITRNIVPSSSITGIFVLSRVFGQFPGTDLTKINTYTALKEIEYLSKLRDNDTLAVSYGINQVLVNQPPFDMIYIMDSINEADIIIEKDRTLHTQIADGIYLLVGSEIGTGSSNAMDNIRSHIASAGLVENRYSGYCSFGVSSCVWKVNEFKINLQNAKDGSAGELIDALLGSSTHKDFKADVQALTQKCGIKENRIQDLLDEFAVSSGSRLESFVDKAKSFSRENLFSTLRMEHDRHLQDMGRLAKENANINYERLKTQFLNDFEVWQKNSLSRSDFLAYLGNLTQELAQSLNNAKDAVQDRARKAERDVNNYKFEDPGQVFPNGSSSLFNQVKTFFKSWFTSSANASDKVDSYAVDVDRQSRAKATLIYCEAAKRLLEELKQEVEKVEVGCKQFRLRLNELQEKLKTQEKRKIEGDAEENNPFVRVLPVCPPVSQKKVSLTQFQDWCKETHLSMSELISTSGSEIAKIIDEFISNEYKEDIDRTINDVLKIKENEEVFTGNQELLNYLSRQAAPLWRYRGTEIPQTQYRVENIAYCGVPDSESLPIKALKSGWLGGKEPQFISTIDPHRITFFNITAGVPIFALTDLKEMKEEYDANKRRVCHLHRKWQDLPDLFPPQIDGMLCFAVAQAPDFQMIRKIGRDPYSLYIDQQRGKPLAKGLEESFEIFQAHADDVDEVKRVITQKLINQDRQVTISLLDKHKQHLEGLISNNGLNTSTIVFVRKQLEAIETYLKEF